MADRVVSADERALRRELQELSKKREALDSSKRRGGGTSAGGAPGRRSVFARLGAEPTRAGAGNRHVQLKENNARGNAARRLGKRENEDNRQSNMTKRQRLHSAVARPEGTYHAEERADGTRATTTATSPTADNARAQQRKQRAVAPYAQKDGIARSRRMFGALMGHLGKAKRQIEKDTDLFKRQDTKQQEAEEREKKQSQNLESRARREAEIKKLEALVARTELDRSEQIARAKLEHLTMVRKSESQSKFLVTISSPPIYYLPARHTKETEDLVAASMEAHEAKMKAKTHSHEEDLRKLEAGFATKLGQLHEELEAAKSGEKAKLSTKDSPREKKDDTKKDVDDDMEQSDEEPSALKKDQHESSGDKDSAMAEEGASEEFAKASAVEVEDEDIVQESVSDSEADSNSAVDSRSNGAAKSEDKNIAKSDRTSGNSVNSATTVTSGTESGERSTRNKTKASSPSQVVKDPEQDKQDPQPSSQHDVTDSAATNGAANHSDDATETDAPVAPKKDQSAEVDKMKVTELRKELKRRGLDVKGLKATLVQRLKESMQDEDESNLADLDTLANMEMEIPYTSPVDPERYGLLTVALLLTGLVFMSLFFTRAVAPKKNVVAELVLAAIAALLLGFGSLFLFLWAEIYV